jgi:hypothetical protein
MPYAAFEACQVQVGDDHKPHRGVRVRCGYCPAELAVPINTSRSYGEDSEQSERMAIAKFEQRGWKIGKTASQHRCPKCFIAIKSAAKHKGEEAMSNKVVPMTSTALASQTVELPRGERAMTRDERRIIIAKMQEIYLNETVGYAGDWTDDKVAEDMGVPRVWVSTIRDETFGPELNENTYKFKGEAQMILAEMQAAYDRSHELLVKSIQMIELLKAVVAKK